MPPNITGTKGDTSGKKTMRRWNVRDGTWVISRGPCGTGWDWELKKWHMSFWGWKMWPSQQPFFAGAPALCDMWERSQPSSRDHLKLTRESDTASSVISYWEYYKVVCNPWWNSTISQIVTETYLSPKGNNSDTLGFLIMKGFFFIRKTQKTSVTISVLNSMHSRIIWASLGVILIG